MTKRTGNPRGRPNVLTGGRVASAKVDRKTYEALRLMSYLDDEKVGVLVRRAIEEFVARNPRKPIKGGIPE